jgi:hypothetical protein
MSQRRPVYSAVAGFATVGLACLAALSLNGAIPLAVPGSQSTPSPAVTPSASPIHQAAASSSERVVPVQAAPAPAKAPAPAAQRAAAPDGYYDQLRARLRWVQTRIGSSTLLTPDLHSRVLLSKAAAQHAGLQDVGLSFMDVYGLINAESSWVPRTGASKNGTPNLGIAQFEPATAKALGLRNPNDPVEAVHVAALHMKEAAIWSAERLQGLTLGVGERAEKLRDGVSIYYNLSVRGRAAWNGRNTQQLPRETQLHIRNARVGAQEAAFVDAQLQTAKFNPRRGEAVLTAGLPSGS